MNVMYTRKCKDCGKTYDTYKQNTSLCPDCREFRNKKKKQKMKSEAILSINGVLRIGRIVNEVKNTRYQYGDIVALIENTKAEHCVCCGEVIPEGRMVCPQCEAKAERRK